MGRTVIKSFNGRNLQQMTRETRGICYINILNTGGCLPLPRGYIHFKNKQNCLYNQISKKYFLKLTLIGQSDKAFPLTSKFGLKRLSSFVPGLYTCGKKIRNYV